MPSRQAGAVDEEADDYVSARASPKSPTHLETHNIGNMKFVINKDDGPTATRMEMLSPGPNVDDEDCMVKGCDCARRVRMQETLDAAKRKLEEMLKDEEKQTSKQIRVEARACPVWTAGQFKRVNEGLKFLAKEVQEEASERGVMPYHAFMVGTCIKMMDETNVATWDLMEDVSDATRTDLDQKVKHDSTLWKILETGFELKLPFWAPGIDWDTNVPIERYILMSLVYMVLHGNDNEGTESFLLSALPDGDELKELLQDYDDGSGCVVNAVARRVKSNSIEE